MALLLFYNRVWDFVMSGCQSRSFKPFAKDLHKFFTIHS